MYFFFWSVLALLLTCALTPGLLGLGLFSILSVFLGSFQPFSLSRTIAIPFSLVPGLVRFPRLHFYLFPIELPILYIQFDHKSAFSAVPCTKQLKIIYVFFCSCLT